MEGKWDWWIKNFEGLLFGDRRRNSSAGEKEHSRKKCKGIKKHKRRKKIEIHDQNFFTTIYN